MCSDGLLKQHFPLSSVAAVKCQIITGAEPSATVPSTYHELTSHEDVIEEIHEGQGVVLSVIID